VKPNLLIVLSDQLRRQALSVYGDPDARTPHTAQLAADGIRFEHACATYPVCVPFRFTMMTGHYAHSRVIPAIEYRMSPTERTLADEFNDAGYETIYVGKWHLDGGHGRMGSALQVGRMPIALHNQGRWRKWLGFELRNDPFDTCYFEDGDPTPRPIEKYQTDGLFDLGMDHLRSSRDGSRPFCMVISVEPPHDPFVAPPDLQALWEERDIALPPNFQIDDPQQRQRVILDRKRYNAMVENLDQNVGRLRQFLVQQQLADDTIVVFISDHGELGGSHGLVRKQWPYEESIGIPFIVYDPRCHGPARAHPGGVPGGPVPSVADSHPDRAPGVTCPNPVCAEDLFPTFLGLCGLPERDGLPGVDLAPIICGESEGLDRQGVLLEFVAELRERAPFYDAVWRGFRTRRHKYTVRGDNMGGRPWQLFDLESDPWEQHNLIDDPAAADTAADLHRMLCERLVETHDHFVLLPAYGCQGVNDWVNA